MNTASSDQPELPEPKDHRQSTTARPSHSDRWLLASIMTVLLLWGLYLARGAFLLRHNLLQGALVLACVLAFLCFWGILLVTRRHRSVGDGSVPAAHRFSKACGSGFAISLLGFLLTLIALLLVPKSPIGNRLTYISLLFNPLGLLLAVIGLSNPRGSAGKNLGLATFPLTLGWIVAAVLYITA